MIIAGIFLCKLCAVLASSGSGAPGGVFTPTLFIGLAIGMLYGRSLGLWFPDGEEITLLLGLTGMATLLAATTHAPIMSTLMICEMTGEYQLLPGLLIACVIASVTRGRYTVTLSTASTLRSIAKRMYCPSSRCSARGR